MVPLIVTIVVILLVAASIVAARHVRHPEQTASHTDEHPDTTDDRFHAGSDRPAGPDAEDPIGPTRVDDAPGGPPSPGDVGSDHPQG